MLEDNKKLVTVSFALLGALCAFLFSVFFSFLAAHLAAVERFKSQELVSNILVVGVGLVVFSVLNFNSKSVDFTDSVISELKKVVWPSKKETGLMTFIVIIALVLSGIVIGVYDSVWAYLVRLVVK